MLKLIVWFFDRIVILIGALLGSQIPEFIQQYTQRLGGHVDELSHLLSLMRQAAAMTNKSLESYIHKFMINSDPDFVSQGQFMNTMLHRWEQLSQSLKNLLGSNVWDRSYIFFTQYDKEIVESTIRSFQPGFAFTVEGLCYALAGMVIIYGVYQGILKLLKSIIGLFKPCKKELRNT